MSQKYPTVKPEPVSSITESELFYCCFSHYGRKKKVFTEFMKAYKKAKEFKQKVYECSVNKGTYHITTKKF
jgi:hypothetical protein